MDKLWISGFPHNLRVRVRFRIRVTGYVMIRVRYVWFVLAIHGLYRQFMDSTGYSWIVQICTLRTTYIKCKLGHYEQLTQ